MEIDKIYCEDCLETLARMDDNSIDLVVTSPPYNKGYYANKNAAQSDVWGGLNGRKIAYDIYEDEMQPEAYEQWQRTILNECLRVLKPTGSIFYNHKDILYKGISIVPKWVFDYQLKQTIIWDRGSSPMIDPHYFMPINEWIFWITKNPKLTHFNKELSAYKSNIWRVNTEKNPHPAPFPLKLVNSIIASCCPPNGIVYDPFMGSGTTALSTIHVGDNRHFVGSEISQEYCDYAYNRINTKLSEPTLF